MLSPRSASFTALTKSSAAARSSNTAAAVVRAVEPVDHRLEVGRDVAVPVRQRVHVCDGRSAPPCRASPRLTGLNSSAISRNLRSFGSDVLLVLAAARQSQRRRSRRGSSRRRRSDAVYWSLAHHLTAAASLRGAGFVMRPRPMLVFARSRL